MWSASTPRAPRPPQVPLACNTPSGTSPMPHSWAAWHTLIQALCCQHGFGSGILTAPAAPGLQDQLKVENVVLVPLKTNHVAPRRRQNPWQLTPDSLSLISQAVRDDTSRSQSRLAQLRKRCFHVALKLLKCLTLLYMVYGTCLRAYSNPIDEFYKPTNTTFFGSPHCTIVAFDQRGFSNYYINDKRVQRGNPQKMPKSWKPEKKKDK